MINIKEIKNIFMSLLISYYLTVSFQTNASEQQSIFQRESRDLNKKTISNENLNNMKSHQKKEFEKLDFGHDSKINKERNMASIIILSIIIVGAISYIMDVFVYGDGPIESSSWLCLLLIAIVIGVMSQTLPTFEKKNEDSKNNFAKRLTKLGVKETIDETKIEFFYDKKQVKKNLDDLLALNEVRNKKFYNLTKKKIFSSLLQTSPIPNNKICIANNQKIDNRNVSYNKGEFEYFKELAKQRWSKEDEKKKGEKLVKSSKTWGTYSWDWFQELSLEYNLG